ncbi:MAG: hypothetical protein LBU06_00895, partial [Desulfovibrio sp.]|nr:hypothetical protein [Desulfovibrio sp.]
PQAGKSPPAPHKTCGFGACLAGAMPIPDKIEAIFIWNWHNPAGGASAVGKSSSRTDDDSSDDDFPRTPSI